MYVGSLIRLMHVFHFVKNIVDSIQKELDMLDAIFWPNRMILREKAEKRTFPRTLTRLCYHSNCHSHAICNHDSSEYQD